MRMAWKDHILKRWASRCLCQHMLLAGHLWPLSNKPTRLKCRVWDSEESSSKVCKHQGFFTTGRAALRWRRSLCPLLEVAGAALRPTEALRLDQPLLEGPHVECWVVGGGCLRGGHWCWPAYRVAVSILALLSFYSPLWPLRPFALELLNVVHKIKGIRHCQVGQGKGLWLSVGSIFQWFSRVWDQSAIKVQNVGKATNALCIWVLNLIWG